jgi:hypothetical protein
VSLDQPASSTELWRIYDQWGLRPEYLLPGLWIESGLNPGVANQAGYPYYGLNQISASYLGGRGIDPNDYLTWSASRQLREVVGPFIGGLIRDLGLLKSGVRFYQANFYPVSVRTAKAPGDPIVCAPSAAYEANKGLDRDHDGCIRVDDIQVYIRQAAAAGPVRQAIAEAYAQRPSETPRDPVVGDEGGFPWGQVVAGGAVLAVAGATAYAIDDSLFRAAWRKFKRWL